MHYTQAFERARAALLVMRRSFVSLKTRIFIPLYPTLVCHHLECAILASSTYLKKDIDHLERLQRLAVRTVKGCRGLFHDEGLETLNRRILGGVDFWRLVIFWSHGGQFVRQNHLSTNWLSILIKCT